MEARWEVRRRQDAQDARNAGRDAQLLGRLLRRGRYRRHRVPGAETRGHPHHAAHGHRTGPLRHLGRSGGRHVQRPGAQARDVLGGAVERRRLGRTGHESSVAILGGAACWAATVEEAGAWLHLALDHGVNHLDIAPQYGAAESVGGPNLLGHREKLFIAGKTLRANPDGVTEQFDTTRRLLNAEVLDLYQAHAVTTLEELDRRSAALERILELRDAGHTRFAGVTGHDLEVPRVHLEALRRFDLDTVMFPV